MSVKLEIQCARDVNDVNMKPHHGNGMTADTSTDAPPPPTNPGDHGGTAARADKSV